MFFEVLKCILAVVAIAWFGSIIWFIVEIIKYLRKELLEEDEDPVE